MVVAALEINSVLATATVIATALEPVNALLDPAEPLGLRHREYIPSEVNRRDHLDVMGVHRHHLFDRLGFGGLLVVQQDRVVVSMILRDPERARLLLPDAARQLGKRDRHLALLRTPFCW